MTNERFKELFDKKCNGILSETEAIEWNEWIERSDHNREMVERIYDEEYLRRTASLLAKARQEDWQDIIENCPELRSEEAAVKSMHNGKFIWVWIAAAIALVLIMLTTFRFFYDKVSHQKLAATKKKQIQDVVPPDINRATITLGNGRVVALDTLTSGILAMQGKVNVVKAGDGQVTYKGPVGKEGIGEVVYNTLTNPRGSKIVSIGLSDGTKVWLNNESILRYPVVFNGNERKVELTGEAYFEVASSIIKSGNKKSFVVVANKATIEVLGTHFNVNNYLDESATKVTLLEGSVKVNVKDKEQSVILKPGEQTAVSKSAQPSHPISVQTEEVIAWKNNTFYFDGENLKTIMKQLARYYNVEVEYEGDTPDKKFGGMINRNKNLTEVLSVLELSGVHFRVEGKKIIVLK